MLSGAAAFAAEPQWREVWPATFHEGKELFSPVWIDLTSLMKTADGYIAFKNATPKRTPFYDKLEVKNERENLSFDLYNYYGIHCQKGLYAYPAITGLRPIARNYNDDESGYNNDIPKAIARIVCSTDTNYRSIPHRVGEVMQLNNTIRDFREYDNAVKSGHLDRLIARVNGNNQQKSSSQKSTNNNTNLDAHKQCLEARDYEGCIKVKTGKQTASPTNDCKPFKWCTAGEGNDILGMPMITGWRMQSNPAKQYVFYRRPELQKANVRGKTDRYIVAELVARRYVSPTSGSPGSTTTIGSATTNCSNYMGSVNCTTTPATTISTPGIAPRSGGVKQDNIHTLIDCKDRTEGAHWNGELKGKWKPIAGTGFEKTANLYCPVINTLELSDFSKYSQ